MKKQTKATKATPAKEPVKEPSEKPVQVKTQSIKATTKKVALVDTLFMLTDAGLNILHGYTEESRKLIEEIKAGNHAPYTFYDAGKPPVYFATQYSDIQPLTFPKPEDYGITSSKLFAMADTYARVIAKFIEIRIKGKPSLLSQIRQIGVIAGPMIVIALVILVIIAMLGG
jgi:hypothetical protein